jgi:DNA-directed RNA polymerase subunit E'/Rpb7
LGWGAAGGLIPLQLIHDNFKYSGTDDPCYVSSDGLDRIRKDSEVRLKIVGTCIENTEIVRALSLRDSSLQLQHRTTAHRHRSQGEARVSLVVKVRWPCGIHPLSITTSLNRPLHLSHPL